MLAKNAPHHLRFFGGSTLGVGLLDAIMKCSRRDLVVVLDVVIKAEEVYPARYSEWNTNRLKEGPNVVVIGGAYRKKCPPVGNEHLCDIAAEENPSA